MIKRILFGAGAAVAGTIILGPAGALAGWKLGGVAATGNPLHLIPGGGFLADGVEIISEMTGDIGGLDQTGPRTKSEWG